MEELSRKTDVSTLGCSEQAHGEALSALTELAGQERTIHREGRLFYSMAMSVPAQPSWDARAKCWHRGPGGGTLRGYHELPPTVTNVPLWLHRLETEGQTAERKEGGKEGRKELVQRRRSCSLDSNYGYLEL